MSAKTPHAVTTKWTATQHGSHLKVTGEVPTPTPGYTITLKKATPQGVNPRILLLEKQVVAPKGITPQHVVTVPVSFSEETKQHYSQVTILPDQVTIKVK